MNRYEIEFLPEYTNDAILDELRRVAALLPQGHFLTRSTYRRLGGRVAASTIARRFDGWKEALGKARLAYLYCGRHVSAKMRAQPGKRLSKGELIEELKRVHAVVGKEYLNTEDFNAISVTSSAAVRGRFRSFSKGLEAAGIPHSPHASGQFTDEECFGNLVDVWTHYGRAPKYRQMFTSPSRIQGKTYVTRWRTWRKALQAFVEWANAEGESPDPELSWKQETALAGNVPPRVPGVSMTERDCRDVRPGLRFKVFRRDRFRCIACGRSPATHLGVELHADHILAVANGGKTTLENLQTLCQECNLGKGRT